MKRVQCSNEACDGVFAHQLSNRTIDIARQKQQFTITGTDYAVTGTCGKCSTKNSLIVENGKIDESDVKYKTETPVPPTDPTVPAPGSDEAGSVPPEVTPVEPPAPIEPPLEPKKYTTA